jgi:hypothetical protein
MLRTGWVGAEPARRLPWVAGAEVESAEVWARAAGPLTNSRKKHSQAGTQPAHRRARKPVAEGKTEDSK